MSKRVRVNQDRELFLTSLKFFRKVMCSTECNIEQKDQYYENLCQDYFRCDLTESDKFNFECITTEWEMRRDYIRRLKLEKA